MTESASLHVVRVVEELALATTPRLRREVEQALAARPSALAVDLSQCPFAGVDAIQALAALTEQAQRQGTALVLIGLREVVRRAITLLGLEERLLLSPA